MKKKDSRQNWGRNYDENEKYNLVNRCVSVNYVSNFKVSSLEMLNDCLTEREVYQLDMDPEEWPHILVEKTECVVVLSESKIVLGYQEILDSVVIKDVKPSYNKNHKILIKKLVTCPTGQGHPESCGGTAWRLEIYQYNPCSFIKLLKNENLD